MKLFSLAITSSKHDIFDYASYDVESEFCVPLCIIQLLSERQRIFVGRASVLVTSILGNLSFLLIKPASSACEILLVKNNANAQNENTYFVFFAHRTRA